MSYTDTYICLCQDPSCTNQQPLCMDTTCREVHHIDVQCKHKTTNIQNSASNYWKPCGHSVQLTCNCPNNGEKETFAGRDGTPERHKCVCPILNLTQEGCKCGSIDPYKPGDIK